MSEIPMIINLCDLRKVENYHNEDLECFFNMADNRYYYRDKKSGEGIYYEGSNPIPVIFVE